MFQLRPLVTFVLGPMALASPASGQLFSDDFDDGNLDGWSLGTSSVGTPQADVVNGQAVLSGDANSIAFLTLESSVDDFSLYTNGEAAVEIDVSGTEGRVVAGLTAFREFGASSQGEILFGVFGDSERVNRAVIVEVMGDSKPALVLDSRFLPFDSMAVRISVEWQQDGYAMRVDDLDSEATISLSSNAPEPLARRGAVELFANNPNPSSDLTFEARFDNFSIVPSSGAVAFFPMVALATVRRSRRK